MTDTRPRETLSVMVLSAERTTSPSGKTYLRVNTAGHGKLSCWDAKLFDRIPANGAATLVVEQNGSFRNVVDVGSAAQAAPPVAGAPDPRQWSITRQVALKCAVDAHREVEPNIPTILETADQFHTWLLGADIENEPF